MPPPAAHWARVVDERRTCVMAFVVCACGQRHWGRYGAAGLLLATPDFDRVLLQRRPVEVHQGGSWACVGGALEPGESVVEAALREAWEEEAIAAASVTQVETVAGTVHPDWSYTYVLATAAADAVQGGRSQSWESDGTAWHDVEAVARLVLHPAFAGDWPRLVARFGELAAG